ncbi:hypothetical protein ACFCYI_17230 [Streptomyces sp. NPDC056257]|uniref:hypothetical protein n=1 Tax=Streptomyces sp. NPDC056257 TaxID=3345765 RepID=UPI0035E15F07
MTTTAAQQERGHPSDDVLGFYTAFPQDGRPLVIMVTRNAGDFQGRIDLETGEIADTNTWR